MPNVSIVITIYNQETHIGKIINSILQQSYDDYEVILINDGSSDNSDLICRSFTDDQRIRYFCIKNIGVSAARNYGILQAIGKYILFIDGDDFIEVDFLKSLVNVITPDIGMVCCGVNKLFGSDKKVYLPKHRHIFKQNPNIRNPVWNKMFNLDIIKNYGVKFPEYSNFAEDYAFVVMYELVCQQLGLHQISIQQPLYNYVQHPKSVMAGLHRNLNKTLQSNNHNIESMLIFFQGFNKKSVDKILKNQVLGYFAIELPLLTIYNQLIAGNISRIECVNTLLLYNSYLQKYRRDFDARLCLKLFRYRIIILFGKIVRLWLK